jgi:hypothetical protein
MSGAVDSYTKNFNLKKVNFNWVTWHDLEHENWDVIDALLYNVAAISNIQGVWENDVTVIVGDRYIDDTSGQIWEVQVAHTTAASGTFAADRTANPTYWLVIEPLTPVSKGTWALSTPYTKNDYVQIEGVVAIAIDTHVSRSSGTIDDDIAHWNYLIDIRTDIAATAADVVSTNADVVLTGNDVGYAEEWAIKAEDSPVSVAAGGDGSTTFSALHWAAKAILSFLTPSDTPSSYTGQANKTVKVNATPNGVEFVDMTAQATEFSKTQNFNATGLSYAGTIAWDTESNQVTGVTLTGNATMGAPTNIVAGAFYSLMITQDGTGSRTLTWSAVFKFTGGVAPTLSLAPSAVDHIVFRGNASNTLQEVGRSLNIG